MSNGINNCFAVAAKALRFLAENPRPSNGNERYNSEHLHQIAGEIDRSVPSTKWTLLSEELPPVRAHVLYWIPSPIGGYFEAGQYREYKRGVLSHRASCGTELKATHWSYDPPQP